MTSNSPSVMNSSLKSSPPPNLANAPPQIVSANNRSTTRLPGRPPKEVTEDHSQTTIGDGFRVVTKRGHATTITTSNNSPSSSPLPKLLIPAKSHLPQASQLKKTTKWVTKTAKKANHRRKRHIPCTAYSSESTPSRSTSRLKTSASINSKP